MLGGAGAEAGARFFNTVPAANIAIEMHLHSSKRARPFFNCFLNK